MSFDLKLGLGAIGFLISFILFFMTGNGMFLVIPVAMIFILIFFGRNADKEDKSNAKMSFTEKLIELNFEPDVFNTSFNLTSAIGVNENKEQLIIINRKRFTEELSFEIIPFNKIIESKVMKNSELVMSTNKSAMLVGGLITGSGVGVLIGGLAAGSKSRNDIRELSLEIVTDNISNPRKIMNFLEDKGTAYKPDSTTSKEYSEVTDNWFRIMNVIVNRNNQKIKNI